VNERTLANQDWFNDKNNLMEYCFPEKASRWTRLTRRRAVIDGMNSSYERIIAQERNSHPKTSIGGNL
jgi:hypothetical protein